MGIHGNIRGGKGRDAVGHQYQQALQGCWLPGPPSTDVPRIMGQVNTWTKALGKSRGLGSP